MILRVYKLTHSNSHLKTQFVLKLVQKDVILFPFYVKCYIFVFMKDHRET